MSRASKSRGLGRVYWDLVAVVLVAILTVGLALQTPTGAGPAYLRVFLGFLYVFFIPGYAITATLFPETGGAGFEPEGHGELDAVERLALSIGLSIAVVPLVGMFWNFTPWGIGIAQVLGSVAGLTIGITLIAGYRRSQLPAMRRFEPTVASRIDSVVESHRQSSQQNRLLNVAIAVLLVTSVAGIAVGVTFPGKGERYTELYLLTEDPATGNLTASGYPTEFAPGERKPIVIGIENHEHRTVEYTVVVQLQRLNNGETKSVIQLSELDRFGLVVAQGETFQQVRYIEPQIVGQDLRLAFLLYKGAPPAEPDIENAYRQVHIWIDVREDQ